ncbi:MAG: tetratricopeptide repeat protein [Bacillus sp. (in: firmicutes)]
MVTVEKVLQLINNGEFDAASKHIYTIQNSGLEEDMFVLAEELSQLGFLEEAIGLYEQLLAVHPDEGELILSLADIFIELDREDDALELVKKVRKSDPVYPSALLLEADLYALNGLEEVAYKKLKEAKQMMPDEKLIDFALAEQCYMQGSFPEAITYYENVLKEHEELAGVGIRQRIAESYSNIGKFEEALGFYEQSLADKVEMNTLFEYGLTAYQAGEYKLAADKLEQLKVMDPEYHSLYLYLTSAYEHQEELEKAYGAAKEGIRQDEFNKELFFKAGKLAFKLNKSEEGISLIREALAIDPGYLEAGITLAKYFTAMERDEDCIDVIKSMMEFGENDPQFDWLLAVSHNRIEEFGKAKDYFEKAFMAYNDSREFLTDYGYFLIEEGDRVAAIEIFNKLLRMDPWNEEYLSVIDNLKGDQ